MFKLVGGVILGLIAILVVEFFVLTGLYLVLGADRAFQAGTFDVTSIWMIGQILVVFIAAMVGGKVCAIVSARSSGVKTLAALLLILGIIGSLPMLRVDLPNIRTGDVSSMQAMGFVREPTWFLLLVPVVGIAGSLIGGRVRSR
jgi:hypothetical protein